jgi:HlyD family secretion protein
MRIPFDQSVVLQQSPMWSRAVVWSMMGVTGAVILWACLAKTEEAVSAPGKLAPQGSVQDIKVPLNGVVQQIHVKDGQAVKKGDLLVKLDTSATLAQLGAFRTVRQALLIENQYYQAVLNGENAKLPTRLNNVMQNLTKSRTVLMAETQLYRSLFNNLSDEGLPPEQRARLLSARTEISSRAAAAELETEQLKQQLEQTRVQLASAQEMLQINQQIYDRIEPVALSGGVSQVQFLQQKQAVQARRAEAAQLVQEQQRLQYAIAQSNQRWQNTVATSTQDILNKIADNEKKIAEIDSQLNKVMVENEKRMVELDQQMQQATMTLRYQEVRSPVDGTVFDLKATNPGYVVNSTEPVLKVVPDNYLQAEVSVTNRDIGFIKEGMPVDVRIDSFPFSEFGDIKGTLIQVGSDALPPTQEQPYFRFPVKVRLDRQDLLVNDRKLRLQSGMAISTNIKIRERRVINILTDGFTQHVESLKSIR